MYLVYQPEGSDEPQRWQYQPTKLMSAEREKLERLTGRDFSDFTKAVISGNSLCRRALLFVFLKREHPTTRFEDVDFAWDELRLEHSRAELQMIREQAADSVPADQRDAVLAQLDKEIAEAHDEPEGKALPPIAG
ncbi:hypothetical protein [Streptomyces rubellomurinus]|uniref:Uncharacterized protein n=1 Tax=Streptomyces rubellomurinus (strain ATCC 31215) TaxID=359131 RepID=A0A0F2TEC2_STRR3|nr:hypothetical protein [Streptomyces rubellomurinus]KJS60655.1 hypothetical protein VM95_19735 [Streptomyces rubellomurinus]